VTVYLLFKEIQSDITSMAGGISIGALTDFIGDHNNLKKLGEFVTLLDSVAGYTTSITPRLASNLADVCGIISGNIVEQLKAVANMESKTELVSTIDLANVVNSKIFSLDAVKVLPISNDICRGA
jgi:hypothetical protein